MNWRDIISDPEEIPVFMALDGPEHTWRTFGGIARQTGMSETRVAQIIAKYSPTFVRLSETPSISTRKPLVGLVEKVGSARSGSILTGTS
ncbi:MAG: hypothetical protein JO295_07835 [Verrucomicrobia bacterium]|nr:hypothetical protein [Verrucomicrobiota bacterium]